MGATMTIDPDEMMSMWMKTVQSMDIGDRPMMNPARTRRSIGDIIKGADGGLVFDTEPAAYYQLLSKLKPDAS
jgi:hypothetical protein